MPPIEVNPLVDLDLREGDVELTPDELRGLSFFAMIQNQRKLPRFEEFPRATILRSYNSGEYLWRQGESGFTAFYTLTTADLGKLAETNAAVRAFLPSIPADSATASLATALLSVSRSDDRKPAVRSWWESFRLLGQRPVRSAAARDMPSSIAFDGPVDVDTQTLQAEIKAGELFGEFSCLDGAPRSASVRMEREWYVLEMTRNILSKVETDIGYKRYRDDLYKQRGLGIHLRKFSIFYELTDDEYKPVLEQLRADLDKKEGAEKLVELVDYKDGEVLCDEHDEADSMYLVRGGLVKVVLGISPLLGPDDVGDWKQLCAALLPAAVATPDPKARVWECLVGVQQDLRQGKADGPLPPERRTAVLDALNNVIRDPDFYEPKVMQAAVEKLGLREKATKVVNNRAKLEGSEIRRFNRRLLDELFAPVLSNNWRVTQQPRIVSYRSRGDVIGEMGLVRNKPRSATCVAFTHHGGKRTIVEVLRIHKRFYEALLKDFPGLRTKLGKIVEERERELEKLKTEKIAAAKPTRYSAEFDQLGLAQGQKLMLIDLTRCTRCDECVQACVQTHSDGHSRLLLDGPRVGDFLVPTTCRSCLNPECMMGCPVGSIHRGDGGQMVIENWCIGCSQCALYCPYGAIQMHPIGVISEGADGWRYFPASAVKGDAWRRAGFRDRGWLPGKTPFHEDRELQDRLTQLWGDSSKHAGSEKRGLLFRYSFRLTADRFRTGYDYELKMQGPGPEIRLWWNGNTVPDPWKGQSKDVGKRAPVYVKLSPNLLHVGENVVAVEVIRSDVLFDLALTGVVPSAALSAWRYFPAALVDLAARSPSGQWYRPEFDAAEWDTGRTLPFRYDDMLRSRLAARLRRGTVRAPANQAIAFRCAVSLTTDQIRGAASIPVRLSAPGPEIHVWVNGEALEVAASRPDAEVNVAAPSLRPGENVLAVQATPSSQLFDLALYEVRRAASTTTLELTPTVVEQLAVVCDLCSSLADGPACVKACPHEATLRFPAQSGIPAW